MNPAMDVGKQDLKYRHFLSPANPELRIQRRGGCLSSGQASREQQRQTCLAAVTGNKMVRDNNHEHTDTQEHRWEPCLLSNTEFLVILA